LVISRRPRDSSSAWDNAPSWFGGRPRLGGHAWPRGGPEQAPFFFLAQIDLSEVGRELVRAETPNPLPTGALAFFIGSGGEEHDCAVVHVRRSDSGDWTPPPPDAPAVLEPCGDIFPTSFAPASPRSFPRWPVTVTGLDIAVDADEDAVVAAVARSFARREYFFTAATAYQLVGEGDRRFWWHSAQHYAECLRTSLRQVPGRIEGRRKWLDGARSRVAKLHPVGFFSALGLHSKEPSPEAKKAQEEAARFEAQLAELERSAPEFERFVREVTEWGRASDPWQLMPPEAVAQLRAIFEQGRKVFSEFTRYTTPHSMSDLETETLLALATADERAYATLPEAIRNLINSQYLLPTGSWHQMFGRGVEIQGNAAAENEGNVMLLQLVYDDMLQWRFGDMGAYQFWIPPDDLLRSNWDAVRVSFEAH
jgi:uncharacterized protein DUF1963